MDVNPHSHWEFQLHLWRVMVGLARYILSHTMNTVTINCMGPGGVWHSVDVTPLWHISGTGSVMVLVHVLVHRDWALLLWEFVSEGVTCLGGFAGRVCLLLSGSSSISLYPIVRGLFRLARSSDLLGTFGGASVCIPAYGGWSVLWVVSFSMDTSCFNFISVSSISVVAFRSLLITECCFLFLVLKMTTRMTTPTTMTRSMITTATTMMTNVVVAPSLGRLLVGCVLLLTGAAPVVVIVPALECILLMARVVSVLAVTPSLMVGCMLLLTGTVVDVVIAPSVWGAEVTVTDWERVVFNSVHRKHTSQHFTSIAIKNMEIPYSWKVSLGANFCKFHR